MTKGHPLTDAAPAELAQPWSGSSPPASASVSARTRPRHPPRPASPSFAPRPLACRRSLHVFRPQPELVHVTLLVLQVRPSLHDHLPVEEASMFSALSPSSNPLLLVFQLLLGEEITTDRAIDGLLTLLEHHLVRL